MGALCSQHRRGENEQIVSLAPTPLAEDVTAMPMLPAMINPASAGPRRRCPSACIPGVSVPVPAMIPALPNITWTGRYAPALDYRNRRCNPNHNFRAGTERERSGENQPKQSFTQHTLLLIPQRGKSDRKTVCITEHWYALGQPSLNSADSRQTRGWGWRP
jgi:hypothetical protein